METLIKYPALSTAVIAGLGGTAIDNFMPNKSPEKYQASGFLAGGFGYALGGALSYKLGEWSLGPEPLNGIMIASVLVLAGTFWKNM